MSEVSVENVEEQVEEKPAPVRKRTTKKTTAKKTTAKKTTRKPRATKKVSEENPEVENVVIEEATVVNDDGQEVIVGPTKPRRTRSPKSNTQANDDGVIGSNAADRALKNSVPKEIKVEEDTEEKVALWSSRNIRWTAVGTLTKGYNIVKKEAAAKWLGRQGVREATPEEVATHYSK